MQAVEILAWVTLIATDKTGTLTTGDVSSQRRFGRRCCRRERCADPVEQCRVWRPSGHTWPLLPS
jgi:hypothetical protein